MARCARSTLEYYASSPETASAGACELSAHTPAGFAVEAAAETPHHGWSPRKKPPAGGTLFHKALADHNQRGEALTTSELECCVTSPETAKASARALASHASTGLVVEAAAGTPRHGHGTKKRNLPAA